MNSTNQLFIGLAALALIVVGGLLLPSDRAQSFRTESGTLASGFGASSFGGTLDSESCAADCSEAARCDAVNSASYKDADPCAETRGGCAGQGASECKNLEENKTCDGSGARNGCGQGRSQGQCAGSCTGDCS